jgi:hypothetical protein
MGLIHLCGILNEIYFLKDKAYRKNINYARATI